MCPGDLEAGAQAVVERLSDSSSPTLLGCRPSDPIHGSGTPPNAWYRSTSVAPSWATIARIRSFAGTTVTGRSSLGPAHSLRQQRPDEHRQPTAARCADHRA